MSNLFEVFDDNNKLHISDTLPCVYVIDKRKVGQYDEITHFDYISTHRLHYVLSDSSAQIYFLGFDLRQFPNGTSYIDSTAFNSMGFTPSFWDVLIYGNTASVDSLLDVDIYFFGIKETSGANVGLEVYDKAHRTIFTTRYGTQYPKITRFSTYTDGSFAISNEPVLLSTIGADEVKYSAGVMAKRGIPSVIKNGNSITIHKDYISNNFLSYDMNINLYSWATLELETIR